MVAEQRLLSVPELSHHLAESYLTCCLYLQEMLQYKRQNHGKVTARAGSTLAVQSEVWTHLFSLSTLQTNIFIWHRNKMGNMLIHFVTYNL